MEVNQTTKIIINEEDIKQFIIDGINSTHGETIVGSESDIIFDISCQFVNSNDEMIHQPHLNGATVFD